MLDCLYSMESLIKERIDAYAKEIGDNEGSDKALDRLYKYMSIYTSINTLKMSDATRGLVAQMSDAVQNIDIDELKKAGLNFNA